MNISMVVTMYAAVVGSLALLFVLLLARHLARSTDGPQPSSTAARTQGELPSGQTLLVFLSSDCAGCRNSLPGLLELAGRFHGGRDHVLVAISGDRLAAEDLISALNPRTTVLADAAARALTRAYRVTLFPTFLQIAADGDVISTGHTVRELSVAAADA